MCNSFYYLRGGAERVFLELSRLLSEHGHQVIPFSMHHESNLASEYSDYFASYVDYPSLLGKSSGLKSKLQIAERVIYSREAQEKIARLIDDTRPDIAHVHGIAAEISPSILPTIKKAGVPIVQTLHDYRLICPNTSFVSQGEVCERCKTHRYYEVVRRRCKRGSLAASALAGIEITVHKLLRLYEGNVDTFIAPSQFLKDKLREFGIRNPIVQLPNFLDTDLFSPGQKSGDYALYYGRLVDIKGVNTLLKAVSNDPQVKLVVAGRGEAEADMKRYISENELENVTMLGHVDTDALIPLIQDAQFTVVPSEWYENYSMTVIESLACGTPVIGARIGGIPEQVIDGQNGLLFESGNVNELAEKMQLLNANQAMREAMGHDGRQQVLQINSPDRHYQEIMKVYEALLE